MQADTLLQQKLISYEHLPLTILNHSSIKAGHVNLSLLTFQFCGMNQKLKPGDLAKSKLSFYINV